MSEITAEHLDAMAADLHERAAKLYREGQRDRALIVGGIAASLHGHKWRPDSEYIRALGFAVAGDGSAPRLRDCFEAIQRGEPPPTSLPARVADAAKHAENSDVGRAFDAVLRWLGVTP